MATGKIEPAEAMCIRADRIIFVGAEDRAAACAGPRKQVIDAGGRTILPGLIDAHMYIFSGSLAGQTINPSSERMFADKGDRAGASMKDALTRAAPQDHEAALRTWLPKANAAGLTSIFDAGLAAPSQQDGYAILATLADENALPLRVFSSVFAAGRFDKAEIEPAPFVLLSKLKQDFEETGVSPVFIKTFIGGLPEGHTAYLPSPYANNPAVAGAAALSKADLNALVLEGQKRAIPIHMHAKSEAEVRIALDVVEAAQTQTKDRSIRHVVAHKGFIAEEDVARFAQLNITAQTSIWAARSDSNLKEQTRYIGKERRKAGDLINAMMQADAVQSLGTDWPANTDLSTFKPFEMIEVAVTRRLPGETSGAMQSAEEALSVMDAVAAMTTAPAYQLNAEDEIGSLEAGKAADFIVLNQDVFSVPVETIHKTQSVMTVVGGRIVYEIGRDP
ncbi:MAG: amidohydrolase family protein [Pseudomonadota bacterium]